MKILCFIYEKDLFILSLHQLIKMKKKNIIYNL